MKLSTGRLYYELYTKKGLLLNDIELSTAKYDKEIGEKIVNECLVRGMKTKDIMAAAELDYLSAGEILKGRLRYVPGRALAKLMTLFNL